MNVCAAKGSNAPHIFTSVLDGSECLVSAVTTFPLRTLTTLPLVHKIDESQSQCVGSGDKNMPAKN